MRPATLTEGLAVRFSEVALGHVRREYPHVLVHVVEEGLPSTTPSELHPIFYGSFDWHSCVHGYWLLARALRRYPDLATATAVEELFDEQLTHAKVEVERAYFDQPYHRSFERPYGWGWLLKLAAELELLGVERWSRALAPLAERIEQGFLGFLPIATYPVRVGTHANTAFALRLAADYAQVCGREKLSELLLQTALRWYGDDRDCAAWGEPSGNDFLSPALIEAECMRRLLPSAEFLPWLGRFLPGLARLEPRTLFSPAVVTDRSDGQIAHLDGLNLSRAWCLRSLANALPSSDDATAALAAAAATHLDAALEHVTGDYMGEHWLATFAALALDEAG
ncbi:MAG: DUF2891 domain-containing protein [Trueperaceae bacterium]|nr:DUF2891 domain-containing protein [Trueperaceae bacterium]